MDNQDNDAECAIEMEALKTEAHEHLITVQVGSDGHPRRFECTCGRTFSVTEEP